MAQDRAGVVAGVVAGVAAGVAGVAAEAVDAGAAAQQTIQDNKVLSNLGKRYQCYLIPKL